jgi:hypothetical protein
LLVNSALGDGFEALAKDIDLNLVAAVGVVDCSNLCSIGKGNHLGSICWTWVSSCVVEIAWDRVCPFPVMLLMVPLTHKFLTRMKG